MTDSFRALVHQLAQGDVVLGLALVLAIGWIVASCAIAFRPQLFPEAMRRCRRFAWQVGAVLGLEQAYEFTRGQIPHDGDVALFHAYQLLDLEWSHGLFVESRIERFVLQVPLLMNAVDLFYALSHALVTLGVLVLVYTLRPAYYPFLRNMLFVTTALALVAYYVYPTAPPRMLGNYGFVDPLQFHNLVSAGGAQADSFTFNPYAAMPSVHVAYALIVAWTLLLSERQLWVRVLAACYPFAMAATVVMSGNHWILDVVGAVATVLLARALLWSITALRDDLSHRLARVWTRVPA
jgi:membrane-associated phospholipid phosphatase